MPVLTTMSAQFGYGRPIPAAPFTPASIASLQIWFDASDATKVTTSGGAVTLWTDKSANAYTVGQSTPANRPTYPASTTLNGLPGIQMASSTFLSQLGNAMPNFTSSAETSMFIVARRQTVDSTWDIINTMWFPPTLSQTATLRYHFSYKDAAITGVTVYANGVKLGAGSAVAANTHSVCGFTASSTASVISVNGTATNVGGTTLPSANNASTLFVFGDNRNNPALSGDDIIYECVGYNTALTTAQRQPLEGYLAWKWGLQGQLPATHPYKNGPPA